MKQAYFNLSDEKKLKIYKESVKEFAHNNYDNGSLNQIIKNAGISKGGMFKYIDGKRELYLFIIEHIFVSLMSHQKKFLNLETECYLERIKNSLISGMSFYKSNMDEFRVILNALSDVTSECYPEVISIRSSIVPEYEASLISGVNWEMYKQSKTNVIKMSKYLIEGYNVQLMRELNKIESFEEFELSLQDELNLIIETLKSGLGR